MATTARYRDAAAGPTLRAQNQRCSAPRKIETACKRFALHANDKDRPTRIHSPPPHVAKILRALRNDNPKYFFWNGTSARETPGMRWWNTLKTIFKAAGIPDSHPHCLRDTFAVECLIGGIDIKKVSMMLGHSSVAITERHYLPWVQARQTDLDESMRRMWRQTTTRGSKSEGRSSKSSQRKSRSAVSSG